MSARIKRPPELTPAEWLYLAVAHETAALRYALQGAVVAAHGFYLKAAECRRLARDAEGRTDVRIQ